MPVPSAFLASAASDQAPKIKISATVSGRKELCTGEGVDCPATNPGVVSVWVDVKEIKCCIRRWTRRRKRENVVSLNLSDKRLNS